MPDRAMRFERRMSDAEALMWTLEEGDPTLRSTFLNVTLLDRAPDIDGFRRRMAHAVRELPRLRQRVVPPVLRLAPPSWEDDPAFDLDFHVRRLAVPAPGDDRALLDLAARLFEDPFDRCRSPWQFSVVEGLTGGRAALLAKMHHTITDGVGGVRLSAMFLDLERDAPGPAADDTVPVPPHADGPPSLLAGVAGAVGHTLRRQAGVAGRTAATLGGMAVHPTRVAALAGQAGSLARQALVVGSSRSPLWSGRRSLSRRMEVLSVDLETVKRAAKALGATVNDAFVSSVAGGAASYHRAKGADVDELRVTVPVSTRTDGSMGGNAFAPSRVMVPAGLRDPAERLRAVHERLSRVKSEPGLDLVGAAAGVVNLLPPRLATGMVRQQVETVDFAASNVRGAPFDLYIAGAEVLSNHPMGPTAGTAFNATVLSYRGQLDLGLVVDTAAVDDAELLRHSIALAFEELVAVGGGAAVAG